jgi:hypothetical protein
MAGIVTTSTRKSGPGCDHRTLGVTLDGEAINFDALGADLSAVDWSTGTVPQDWLALAPKQLWVRLGALWLHKVKGVAFDDAVGRVCNGEEATNVKQYNFFGPGAALTKTNIGTAYTNIPIGANVERRLIDFTGCTQFRLIVNVNHVTAAAGQLQFRVVRDSDSAVLYESPLLSSSAGEKEADSANDAQAVGGWITLPAAASGLNLARFQGKSSVAADDPIFRGATLYVR